MTKIVSKPNCGNSPKMTFIKAFNVAFAEKDSTFLLENITDDVVWSIVGDKHIEGKKNVEEELEKMKKATASELIIDQILSHGKEGAANGVITLQNGKSYAFADFYQFQGAKGTKIKAITSYVLPLE